MSFMPKAKKADMDEPSKASDLGVAYSVKKRNRKKFAKGGKVDVSAADEDMPTADSDQMSAAKRPEYASKVMPNFHDESRPSADSAHTAEEMAMLDKYRKHLASGGPVEVDFVSAKMEGIDDAHTPESMNMIKGKSTRHASELRAASGMPKADDQDSRGDDMLDQEDPSLPDSIAGAVMAKRRKFAKGGEVDLQDNNGDEDLNNLDDMNYKAARKDTYYDDDQLSAQPMDSNEHGDDIDSDEHDMISAIRRKMRMKRGD